MIYLDNPSTSFPKPKSVAHAIYEYVTSCGVSPGRGSYHLAEQAEQVVQKTRCLLAELLGASSENSIVFTNNATHSLNLAIKGTLQAGDHAIICSYSHNSVIRPLETLKRTLGISYDVIEVSLSGSINLHDVEGKIKPNTKLACFTQASNVIGVVSQYEHAASLCRSKNIRVLLDCTQSLGYCPIAVETMPIDFLAGTGHKTLLGPSGIGFLYVKNHKCLNTMIEGGSGGNYSLSPFHPSQMPYKFEAGTPNTTGISGLKGALEYIQEVTFETIATTSMNLLYLAWNRLSEIDEVTLYGADPRQCKKVPIISFTLSGTLPTELAHQYDAAGICLRSGTQCAPLIHKTLGTLPTGTVRIGFGHYNTQKDIDLFIQTTKSIIRKAHYAKTVRDFIPALMSKAGKPCKSHQASYEEYGQRLRKNSLKKFMSTLTMNP